MKITTGMYNPKNHSSGRIRKIIFKTKTDHERVAKLIKVNTKLLDYGCGKAEVYEINDWHWPKPTLYDPAIPEYEKLPDGPFDGVISTDVMEHIPKEQLPEVVIQIFSRAKKFVYLGIATAPSKTILSNGENAHCTVEPIEFWVSMIEKHVPKKVYAHIKTYGECNSYEILNEDAYLEWYISTL